MGGTSIIFIALSSFVKIYCTRLHLDEILVTRFISKGSYVFLTTILIRSVLCFMFLYILRKLLMLAESRFGWALFAGTQNNQKCFWLSCNARKKALCLASVTYMTRDINDTFVTNHPDDRKPSFAGSWRNTIMISHIQHKTIYFFQNLIYRPLC